MNTSLPPGFLLLQGNRLELLADAVCNWWQRNPLAPLEVETVLVQSQGMGEWLKMAIARRLGVCAATRVELPARFLWRSYRQVLGRSAVPARSPFDRQALTWRLMALLPQLPDSETTAPLRRYLQGGDITRRWELAQRVADLYDQYQVYRADWLTDWEHHRDQLRSDAGQPVYPLPTDQRWQAALWRWLLEQAGPTAAAHTRVALHQRWLQVLSQPNAPAGLPRRVVLFGTTHIPLQTLEALVALSKHTQVLVAVPNPSDALWFDTHGSRPGRDGSAALGHPLLAAWGRQSRDFLRQLSAYDDRAEGRGLAPLPSAPLFAGDEPGRWLHQLQAAIRADEALPTRHSTDPKEPAHASLTLEPSDRSIVFHTAYSPQREVEILHDQLLHALTAPATDGCSRLEPRDIVVMVPDIRTYAPAIRSVFGAFARTDPRYIPWGITDAPADNEHALVSALRWLGAARSQRFSVSEVFSLWRLPSLRARFGVDEASVDTLREWAIEAGVRWGLHAAHQESLGMPALRGQNTWQFGLHRLLLGYAAGTAAPGAPYADIEPAVLAIGTEAPLLGALSGFIAVLNAWWHDCATPRTPQDWSVRLRMLLDALSLASDPQSQGLHLRLTDALSDWVDACDAAALHELLPAPLAVEAWLNAFESHADTQRFTAAGVTFCTLVPLRAIPFPMVCLLGMNEGDFPRAAQRLDIDLMADPRLARAGDRSRHADDRQLMLDAVLSARHTLYVSWVGRNQRDGSALPPSALVDQLLQVLNHTWGTDAVQARRTDHPLQPFSRAYFENSTLWTYAWEWHRLHAAEPSRQEPLHGGPEAVNLPRRAGPPTNPSVWTLTLDDLTRLMTHPIDFYARHRWGFRYVEDQTVDPDDEPLASRGLPQWAWRHAVMHALSRSAHPAAAGGEGPAADVSTEARMQAAIARLRRQGWLPPAAQGELTADELAQALRPPLQWLNAPDTEGATRLPPLPVEYRGHHPEATVLLQDQIADRLQCADGRHLRVQWTASRLVQKPGPESAPERRRLHDSQLFGAWLYGIAAAAEGAPLHLRVIGSDACVDLPPAYPETGRAILHSLMDAAQAIGGALHPPPLAPATVLTFLRARGLDPDHRTTAQDAAAKVYGGSRYRHGAAGECEKPGLRRFFPTADDLWASPQFDGLAQQVYGAYVAAEPAFHVMIWDRSSDALEAEDGE